MTSGHQTATPLSIFWISSSPLSLYFFPSIQKLIIHSKQCCHNPSSRNRNEGRISRCRIWMMMITLATPAKRSWRMATTTINDRTFFGFIWRSLRFLGLLLLSRWWIYFPGIWGQSMQVRSWKSCWRVRSIPWDWKARWRISNRHSAQGNSGFLAGRHVSWGPNQGIRCCLGIFFGSWVHPSLAQHTVVECMNWQSMPASIGLISLNNSKDYDIPTGSDGHVYQLSVVHQIQCLVWPPAHFLTPSHLSNYWIAH